MSHKLWVEKYRPRHISEYVFQNHQHEQSITRMVNERSIPNLLLSGSPGSGKTTLAQILIRAMELDDFDVLTINASDDRGIDTFREDIKSFALSFAISNFKIVHLEEADQLTLAAQMALKRFMEDVSDHVRFILTCNNVNKIIEPLRSRCEELFFKSADVDDITTLAVKILAKEKIKFDLDRVDEYVTRTYPDIRKLIGTLQQNSIDGALRPLPPAGAVSEYQFALLELLKQGDWIKARKLVCESVSGDEWESLYRFLYTNIQDVAGFDKQSVWDEAILVIAEHLYKHTICADSEINCAAMFIRLGQLIK